MAWKPTESRKAMKREVGDRINILGDCYSIVSFLGKGKGGYSYLSEDSKGKRYTLKCFHNEAVPYYTFTRNKVECEVEAYAFLSSSSIPIPRLLYWDKERNIILKEFIDGETALERRDQGEDLSYLFPLLEKMSCEMKRRGYNLDWYPSNFIYSSSRLFYIDYEINPYEEKWSLNAWGLDHWKRE